MAPSFDDNDEKLDALQQRLDAATTSLEKVTRHFDGNGFERSISRALQKQQQTLERQLNKMVQDAFISAAGGGKSGRGQIVNSLLKIIPGFSRGGILSRSTPLAHTAEIGPEVVLPLKKTRDGSLGVVAQSGGNNQFSQSGATKQNNRPIHITVVNPNGGSALSADDQTALADAVSQMVDDAVDHRLDAQLREGGMIGGLHRSRMFNS